MPLELVRKDICSIKTDALVNAANGRLMRGGGVCGAIFAAAGYELDAACAKLAPVNTGSCAITPGFNSKARYIIHAVGPVWQGGGHNEERLLRSCYRESLDTALRYGLKSIAFPLISSGIYGYPPAQAFTAAVDEIRIWLDAHDEDMLVMLVLFDKNAVRAALEHSAGLQEFIDDNYTEPFTRANKLRRRPDAELSACLPEPVVFEDICLDGYDTGKAVTASSPLEEMLKNAGEPFTDRLFRMIDERGLKDPDVYKRANIDRKLFSKIRSNREYHPKKSTVLALAVALELSEDEAGDLLVSAGYAFSPSDKTDIIIRFHLETGSYKIDDVNSHLFEYGLPCLGV